MPGDPDAPPNEGVDEQFLEEYLKGKSTVSQQYRQMSADDVPADLDRRVLRQAHDAVKQRKPSNVWRRWSAPLALAASAVLVLSIVIESGVQRDSMSALTNVRSDSARAAEAAAERERRKEEDKAVVNVELKAAAPPPPALSISVPEELAPVLADAPAFVSPPAMAPAPAAENVTVTAERLRQSVQDSPSPVTSITEEDSTTAVQATTQVQPPQIPAQEPQARLSGSVRANRPIETRTQDSRYEEPDLSEVIVTGTHRRRAQLAGPRSTIAIPPPSYEDEEPETASEAAGGNLMPEHTDPEAWLRDIRQLRKDDKQEEADREWRRFREAFPDYEVAETDIARGSKNP
jgi:hypothetical protein